MKSYFVALIIAALTVAISACLPDPHTDEETDEEPEISYDYLPDTYPNASSLDILRGPYLQNVGNDSITVMWEAATECKGIVEYWSDGKYDYVADELFAARHEIVLEELPMNASEISYRFRCISPVDAEADGEPAAAEIGEEISFRLAPADEPYRFAIYGDNRTLPLMHKSVVDQMVEAQPDLAINVGDVVTTGGIYEQWDTEFFEPASELLKSVPMFVAIGNHENNAQHFYDLLSQPMPENYFTFTYGNSFHIVMDSNWHSLYPGCPQLEWFEEVLQSEEALEATWIFAYAHHPPYSEGWVGYDGDMLMRAFALPLAEDYGVDFFFNGHTHDYERGELNGVVWVITGGGGSSLDSWDIDFDHITEYAAILHFVQIDVDGPNLYYSAIDVDGNIIDSFELEK
jgi:Calcineurin-like phosphoesterase